MQAPARAPRCAADADRDLKERAGGACPACRAPPAAPGNVKRLERLLVTRTEGKHAALRSGLAWATGRGAGRDDAKATRLYEAAARGGHVNHVRLRHFMDEGRGLARDPAKAVA